MEKVQTRLCLNELVHHVAQDIVKLPQSVKAQQGGVQKCLRVGAFKLIQKRYQFRI